jgi:DNA-binding MarR family transcriptional regulator
MSTRAPSKRKNVVDDARQKAAATLGARLRRLSERIDSDASRIYADAGLAFEQRWFGTVHLLAGGAGLSVGEIAEKLGIRHVSVSQTRASLEKAGIVACEADPADARRRTLRLTRKGHQLVAKLTPFSDALSQVAIELDEEAENVVAALERLDKALDRRSLLERVRERIAKRPSAR